MSGRRVYFIKPIGMDGPVKIGVSQSPEGRRETLETWSPFPLEVAASIEGDERLEMQFHAQFRVDHQHREWFRASPELLATIAAISAGTFDLSSLPEAKRLGYRSVKRPAHLGPQLSYTLRVGHTERRTGLLCPVEPRGIILANDSALVAAVDLFLSDPIRHGVPRTNANYAKRYEAYHARKRDA